MLALTACARERSGEVHEGAAGPDTVQVSMHDDEFAPKDLHLEADGCRWIGPPCTFGPASPVSEPAMRRIDASITFTVRDPSPDLADAASRAVLIARLVREGLPTVRETG